MTIINIIVLILVIIGALNWGFIGFFNYDVISAIFGGVVTATYTGFERFIFAIIGLCGIWALSFFARMGSSQKESCDDESSSCCKGEDKKDKDQK
ncbi:MAG: hypothetical protein A3F09_00335 [Chlamydiae bacterium RIFCSPHIGHO2_12_FULL_49_11]|nr:MAG: hypothetical protein A3F09_00335 [Chlamydiae bacterium RIFCSPHIGHO2_12_FULL_49_11]